MPTPYRRKRVERAFTQDEVASMGKTSDLDLAERIGCSMSKVWRHRTRLGIAAYRKWRPVDFKLIKK